MTRALRSPALVAVTLALLAACGGPSASKSPTGATPDDASVASAADATPETAHGENAVDSPAEASCPSTFLDAEKSRACAIGLTKSCRYAEGTCSCHAPPQCGGAMRRPPEQGEPGIWSCGSNDPRVVDLAGCPYVVPAEGAGCSRAGQQCSYGPCSWMRTTATCRSAGWHIEQIRSPPPP